MLRAELADLHCASDDSEEPLSSTQIRNAAYPIPARTAGPRPASAYKLAGILFSLLVHIALAVGLLTQRMTEEQVALPRSPVVVELLPSNPLASSPVRKPDIKPSATQDLQSDRKRAEAARYHATSTAALPSAGLPTLPIPSVELPQPRPASEDMPTPPAPPLSETASETWEAKVVAALNRQRRYPRLAQARREQGVPWIRFVMDREGMVLSSKLERSSGFPDLDREAVALPKRAQPLPQPPADKGGMTVELILPVEFSMR